MGIGGIKRSSESVGSGVCVSSKGYIVTVRGNLEESLTALKSPIEIDGKMTKSAEVSVLRENSEGGLLYITIQEGRNRQIRRMCEEMNAKAKKMLEEKGISGSLSWSPFSCSTHYVNNKEIESEISKKKSEIKANTNTKLRNLLLEIELGAKKDEFLDIVSNFKLEI